jgi:hypothetical protein
VRDAYGDVLEHLKSSIVVFETVNLICGRIKS